MQHAGTAIGTALRRRMIALFALFALVLGAIALSMPAHADAAAQGDTTVRIQAFPPAVLITAANEIGRASCRERV